MPDFPLAKPEAIGLDPARLQRAYDLLQRWVERDKLPAAGICVGRRGKAVEPRMFGRLRPEAKAPPLPKDALFLIASPTKPVTCTALMMLVERGELTIEEKVATFVPKFAANGKQDVQVRHLLTHTSGLPDMLPNNEELRKAHKPLSAFVEETCKLPLASPPGTKVVYQSMGIAILGEIVHQISGLTIQEFLRKEIFTPLGMNDTSLGWDPARKERIAAVRVPPELEKADWHWNSPYWLAFGAPWGGLISSPADWARFCLMMLNRGTLGDVRLLSPATVRAMTANQLAPMPLVPEEERRSRPWGLGWRLNWPGNPSSFGDLLGPRCFGHWGATGTLVWMDPETDTFCVLLTTEPQADSSRMLARVSNIVAGAVM
ncbi:MAG: beta-lactamase family protein [Gemmataceae bacterium]|nr:beta-lactamase family protein [Gemmataceae bacterium]